MNFSAAAIKEVDSNTQDFCFFLRASLPDWSSEPRVAWSTFCRKQSNRKKRGPGILGSSTGFQRGAGAELAQLVERWTHNSEVESVAWMNSEGSGLGLQIQGGLSSQWFESTFCAFLHQKSLQSNPRQQTRLALTSAPRLTKSGER